MARDEAYREAEKRIEAARRKGATKLTLRSIGLSELPESLGQLTQLQSLDLSRNQLTALPESLGQLTQLQSLDLSRNQLMALPESLGQLMQLRSLDLSHSQLTALPKWLSQLTRMLSLNLSNNQLTALQESLGQFTQLQLFNLSNNQLTVLPEWLGNLIELEILLIFGNQLTELPKSINQLSKLKTLSISENRFKFLTDRIGKLKSLTGLFASNNEIEELPATVGDLKELEVLILGGTSIASYDYGGRVTVISYNEKEVSAPGNKLKTLPLSISQLPKLRAICLDYNPLNPELAEAYKQGLDAVKAYLRAKAEAGQIILNEAKLILVGEGEVGKSCLLGALRGDPWEEGRPTTHGIEIKPVKVIDPESKKEITLNGWDFGGQRIYRPTHQLFFSAPAVYLVVWKPREGPQQGFVKEWIQLVKRREPSAKIIVVATHGGPQQRQPDIDRQELWDLFGKETIVNFFFVESKPDEHGKRKGIAELKLAIARVAATLPEVGRAVPKSFADVRQALQAKGVPYLPLDEVLAICRGHKMDDEIARLFITISHCLGHLTHYENDPALRDIVILRPDWLATAMSYVLDDEVTRKAHGLVNFSRLSQLWNDSSRPEDTRYSEHLHRIFLRLMERFDLSYRVAGLTRNEDEKPVSLIAQLVQDNRPEKDLAREWVDYPNDGNLQQVQICRIVDKQTGQSANAEGLFYQLIVRLHKYSLGRVNFNDSVHWQRGLIIEDEYKSRAFLEHVGNDVKITVHAPYPEGFLGMLTREVKYLVDSFWEGLRCDVMVPCVEPCGRKAVGTGLYEVEKLIDSKRKSRNEFPCPVCTEWQNIDLLLRNAPAAAPPISLETLQVEFASIKDKLNEVNSNTLRVLSQVDKSYTDLLQVLTDEAKEGPRLFSLVPVDRKAFNPKKWVSAKFRLTLWCEHSRKPLPVLYGKGSEKGVYELELQREWVKKAAPVLKLVAGTLRLVLPVTTSATDLILDDKAFERFEEELDFGQKCIEATSEGEEKIEDWLKGKDPSGLEHGEAIRAQGSVLRELQALLKEKDPGFGGLERVTNKRQEFLWVHPQFVGEY